MLNLNLTALSRGDVRVRGEIPPDDPTWEGMGLDLREPLVVDLEAREVGKGILVRGTVHTTLDRECRRCLTHVPLVVDETVDFLFEPLEDQTEEEELSGEVYPLPARATELDLGPPLREELLLRLPEFVVCREDCRGLCPHCGTDLNQGSCECAPEAEPSAWDALKKIKFD